LFGIAPRVGSALGHRAVRHEPIAPAQMHQEEQGSVLVAGIVARSAVHTG